MIAWSATPAGSSSPPDERGVPDGPSPVLISVRGIAARRGAFSLDALSFEVAGGQIVGLLGPNGAGKSTAFAMLAGLLLPDSGTVHLEGADVTSWPLWRRARAGLGYLPQGPSLIPSLSVLENVALVAPQDVALAALSDAGLADLAARSSSALSGGERRRVELARLCAAAPRVALLDEPFSGVDPIHVIEIQRRLLALAAAGVAVLLTDHAVHAVLPICHRAILIDRGAVVIAGTPAEIAENAVARARWLGDGSSAFDAVGGFTHRPRDL